MGAGITLGRIAGIQIRIDWSLLIIFTLITVILGAAVFPTWHPDWAAGLIWATALVAAFLFFVSVLLHELSHALVGRKFGAHVPRITLFVFGGMAEMESEPKTWKAEFWIAIVGPITSFIIGFICLYLSIALAGLEQRDLEDPQRVFAALGPLATLLFWLGPINIILAIFNLVPGFPLDGGRVLRAVIWGLTGNQHKATRWATGAGQAFAWLLIGSGFAMILGAQIPIFGGGTVNGLWLAFIGWFLNNAAIMSYRQMTVQESLNKVPVFKLMQSDVTQVTPDMALTTLIDEYLFRSNQRCFPVVSDDVLQGLICLEDVRGTALEDRMNKVVADVMTPTHSLKTLAPDDDGAKALKLLGESSVNQLPVLEGQRLVGLLTRENVMRWLALKNRNEG